ncbi:putative NADH:ubiquinone/plastoquinone oxidoreductase, chain 3 [Helianthus annuus]|uniref:NADH-ubiquinone oxidoreductase chain 3 n=1 Tax=Helianthus annuus TaxID=4232 RepID=A0A251V1D0_HELAN|nr:putative NADH:ubiquinone/plastoquinone oxidoreductase, chain 3 [Helianthus annuus]KAJ0589908.1 putative NADH:ubiquinone/plastoquinone oxidoreductase, chain 3 [Helianthus annuus]KAJ0758450.1 putative NADH:ubiquinone/plastoquinone oxidoreductase, chain 3 [Helianthus annuus]KAJ0927848.1 putative NADH:ubiquinone/plastoquinone oxidoreductase, chain 3 [Helianthus annuus]KAJ0932262.1 putative NADH:ubiquinone/plastoquinone oxidoreductase, chain 3 [Helianthus annuus]
MITQPKPWFEASVLIPILVFFISGFLAPSSKGPEKLSSYESGIEPIGDAWLQFRIRYYMFALVFVVFDVETVFLYPWAMSFDLHRRVLRFRKNSSCSGPQAKGFSF